MIGEGDWIKGDWLGRLAREIGLGEKRGRVIGEREERGKSDRRE